MTWPTVQVEAAGAEQGVRQSFFSAALILEMAGHLRDMGNEDRARVEAVLRVFTDVSAQRSLDTATEDVAALESANGSMCRQRH